MEKRDVLYITCGGRLYYYNKKDPRVLFCDNAPRVVKLEGRKDFVCAPDIIADFTKLPFPDNSFSVVNFDPPHLVRAGKDSYLRAKYGLLPENWEELLEKGFNEGMRVLRPGGTLVFKWSDVQIPFSKVRKIIGDPVFGDRKGKTRWSVYIK